VDWVIPDYIKDVIDETILETKHGRSTDSQSVSFLIEEFFYYRFYSFCCYYIFNGPSCCIDWSELYIMGKHTVWVIQTVRNDYRAFEAMLGDVENITANL
jgi:hypothetical protein